MTHFLARVNAKGGTIADYSNNCQLSSSNVVVVPGNGVFGGGGILFAGSGASSITLSGALSKLTIDDDFTLSFWYKPLGVKDPYPCNFCFTTDSHYENCSYLYSGQMCVRQIVGTGVSTSKNYIGGGYQDSWNHCAIVRVNGTTLRGFINGELQSEYTGRYASEFVCSKYTISAVPTSPNNSSFYGYMDDICLVKDKALWTENFVPPTNYLYSPPSLWVSTSGVWGVK